MSGKAPFFITGANVKLKVNGVTLAYATDFQYSIKIKTQDARILGVMEHDTSESLSYDVNGSFTIIRYASDLKGTLTNKGYSVPNGTSSLGNGVGSWTPNQPNGIGGIVRNSGNFTNDGRANESLDPSKLASSTWFDIECYQVYPGGQTGLARIRNCKITQADTRVGVKGLMTQTFSFIANGVDEDSFLANASGQGQTNA
jgi:hypothetical protein